MPIAAPDPESKVSHVDDWVLRRKHTIAELEVGFIALPNAPISPSEKGETSPSARSVTATRRPASGCTSSTAAAPTGPSAPARSSAPTRRQTTTLVNGITRTHSRDYLWMGGEGRYIPLHLKTVEAWIGIAVGGVVVADRFTTQLPIRAQVATDLGTSQVTVRSEGFSLGLQAGGDWQLGENLLVGLALRFDNWILPAAGTEQCTPIGDCATLSGPVTEIEVGLRVGYRIRL